MLLTYLQLRRSVSQRSLVNNDETKLAHVEEGPCSQIFWICFQSSVSNCFQFPLTVLKLCVTLKRHQVPESLSPSFFFSPGTLICSAQDCFFLYLSLSRSHFLFFFTHHNFSHITFGSKFSVYSIKNVFLLPLFPSPLLFLLLFLATFLRCPCTGSTCPSCVAHLDVGPTSARP